MASKKRLNDFRRYPIRVTVRRIFVTSAQSEVDDSRPTINK